VAGTLGTLAWLLLGVGLVTIDRVRQRSSEVGEA